MSYTPSYPQRINYENDPSTATPLNQTNLNKMDNAIYQHDRALSAQDERISDLESEDKVTSFKGRTGVVTPADDDYTIVQIKATGSEGQIPALNAQGKLEMVTPNKAGHDIVDKVGNVMTTRDNLQFVGAVSVTDDATNNKTIVNVTGGGGGGGGHTIEDTDATTMPQEENLQFVGVYTEDDATNDRTKVNIVREMTSAQMDALTPAQKKGFIRTTDEPDNPIMDEYTFILKNQTLTFSNLVATITDARVTASTYAMVYFNNATLQAAANAGVVVDTSTGTITFTALSVPSTSLVCDIVCRKG